MKAIRVKYLGPTNTKGSRLRASAEGGCSKTIPYPHELSGEACYAAAAVALCEKMNWGGSLIGGCLTGGDYVFCFAGGEEYRLVNVKREVRHG